MLTSSMGRGPAALLLLVLSCAPDLPLDPEEVDQYFQFGVLDPESGEITSQGTILPADGFSTLELTARLQDMSSRSQTKVLFTLTGGGRLKGDKDGDGSLEVPASPAGEALTTLVSSTTTETVRVRATVASTPASGEVVVRYIAAELDSILRFVDAPSIAPADGATQMLFRLWVSPRIPEEEREVALRVTGGASVVGASGSNTSIAVGPGAIASFGLRSPSDVGSGVLSASLAGFTREVPLVYATAYPTSVRVNAAAFAMAPDAEATVVASLVRAVGTVSRGVLVWFSACEVVEDGPCGGANRPLGAFRDQTRSDASGGASAKFTPAGFEGHIRIEVTVDGTEASGFTVLESREPDGG